MATKILVVEDEKGARAYLDDALSSDGYEVKTVESGFEALDQLGNGNLPDLILLDIMMEGMDGLETLKKIRDELKLVDIPICMITASVDVEKAVRAFRDGADGYLVKPFDLQELLHRVEELTAD